MRRNRNAVLAMCALAGFAFPVFGQGGIGSGNVAPHVPHPYTAKFRITTEQTLANGTTITHERTEIVVMDSEGRRLTASTFPVSEQIPERTMVNVSDPVARTSTNWMVPGKRAQVQHRPAASESGQGATCWTTVVPQATTVPLSPDRAAGTVTASVGAGGTSTVAPKRRTASNKEDLGTQTIQGVVATGTRFTLTTPAGADGNDAPLVRVREVWDAKSLGLMVREVTDDPVTGKLTKELVELSQSEPDPATFQPPEGYVVVTQELHAIPCQ
jgi:hypothetical protein